MTLEFRTKEIEAQPFVGIRVQTTMAKVAGEMGQLLGEVFGYVQGKGIAPAGMPFTIYHSMEVDNLDMECGIPVITATEGEGRVQLGMLPGGKVATVTHMGPYENLKITWGALMQWVESQGLQPAGAPWECYFTDPKEEPDQSKWRTDVFVPVR